MSVDPAAIHAELLGHRFDFLTAPGLFSATRVDDGTRLLLSHLPSQPPRSVLDLGCGYGALGLPVASAHPDARVLLVDRDLLAVATARRNALAAGLERVALQGSLGYRNLPAETFDWVLCNVPARIGPEAIAYILGEGIRRLAPGGELRLVVIRDLESVVGRVARERDLNVEHVTSDARHGIFRASRTPTSVSHPVSSLSKQTTQAPAASGGSPDVATAQDSADHEAIYLRDSVTPQGFDSTPLDRPHDISEDPAHLKDGLPLFLECLPRAAAGRALVWRGGYGAVALALTTRGARVLAADKDLLATTFTRRNATRRGLTVDTAEVLAPSQLPDSDQFDLIAGELSAPAGEEATRAEVAACLVRAQPRATVLWLGLSKLVRDWLDGRGQWESSLLASRGSYSIMRLSRGSPRKRG